MEIYDIVNSISSIEGRNLVLHRSMKVQKIKLYKKFVYDVYNIVNGEKELVFNKEYIMKVPDVEIEKKWSESDKSFLMELLKRFKYGDEQIPDTNN